MYLETNLYERPQDRCSQIYIGIYLYKLVCRRTPSWWAKDSINGFSFSAKVSFFLNRTQNTVLPHARLDVSSSSLSSPCLLRALWDTLWPFFRFTEGSFRSPGVPTYNIIILRFFHLPRHGRILRCIREIPDHFI